MLRTGTTNAPALVAVALGILLAAFAAASATVAPSVALAFVLLAFAGAVLYGHPAALIALTLVLAFASLPAAIPNSLNLGPVWVYPYEIFLLAGFVWAMRQCTSRKAKLAATVLSVWVALGALWGLFGGADPARVLSDIRYPIELAAAMIVSAAAIQRGMAPFLLRIIKWILWISALFVVIASTTNFSVAGRAEGTNLLDRESGVTRILTPTNFLALAVVCLCAALLTANKVSLRVAASYAVPAVLIVVLAFSRNHVVGLAVTFVAALFAGISAKRLSSVLAKSVFVISAASVLAIILINFPTIVPGGPWIAANLSGYADRVVGGLSSESRAVDPSTIYRENEAKALWQGIGSSPIFGHGFGFQYKDPTGAPGSFWYERAPYYAHNFYLWAWVKTGIVGLIMVLGALFTGIVHAIVRADDAVRASIAAAGAGLLAVSLFAPLPIDSPAAILLGGVVGAVLATGQETPRQDSTRSRGRESLPVHSNGVSHDGSPRSVGHESAVDSPKHSLVRRKDW